MKDNKLKMRLQYFADPNNGGEGGDGGTGGDDGGKKNVSFEDFQNLSKSVGDIGAMMKKFMESSQNSNSSSANSSAQSSTADSSSSSASSASSNASNSASSASMSPEMKKLMEQNKSMEDYINQQKAEASKANLLGIAQAKAKELGVNISGMENNLLGGDEATTKQNVEAFAKSVQANNQSTDNGFKVNSSNFKDGNSFMKTMLANAFPNSNK